MNPIPLALASVLLLSTSAHAETLTWQGNIPSNRSVVQIPITLANPLTGVHIWTDTYQHGTHFDPITALWRDGVLLHENDDNPWLMPGQTWFDSGLAFTTLEAGTYLLTITNFNNFARGSLFSDGFRFDDPDYPALDLNNCDPQGDYCPGSFWRIHLQDGFNVPAVPEPAHALLLSTGILFLAVRRRVSRKYS